MMSRPEIWEEGSWKFLNLQLAKLGGKGSLLERSFD
jgi:hypothetical protein